MKRILLAAAAIASLTACSAQAADPTASLNVNVKHGCHDFRDAMGKLSASLKVQDMTSAASLWNSAGPGIIAELEQSGDTQLAQGAAKLENLSGELVDPIAFTAGSSDADGINQVGDRCTVLGL